MSCGHSLHSLLDNLPSNSGWDSQPNHQFEVALGNSGSPISIYNNWSIETSPAQLYKLKIIHKGGGLQMRIGH